MDQTQDSRKTIGIIGIGLMGYAFAERFLSQGWTVHLYNRTPERIQDLSNKGAQCHASADSLFEHCDCALLMLANFDAIDQTLSSSLSKGLLQSKTILQMATISPKQSRQLADMIEKDGGQYLESPVLGSIPEAINGNLIIMAGGDATLFAQQLPVLKVLGNEPRLIGPAGTAAALKLSMNQLIAALTAGFSLSLAYALKNGVDVDLFMDTLRDSALYAKTYDKKLDKYLSREFGQANFSTQHLLKDIRLFIDDADTRGLDTSALEAIEIITQRAIDQGLASVDYSSIYQVIDPDRPL